ncbi:Tat (twin-arginine translocation) pathway signal sequence [Catalinimonas alkaloidigena]|uniref:Tat (Twin-arginine translocation) pathway signal sequence n=1 Tax=Catalinimonas alkaloidigena TaxID=1075417 RepID=A0A1G8WAP5_9BACT|nr:metallophosphoesterase [Catalinimonas alkaloidigena]SDJ74660.1 Tat (twin-arginine translocation) pathway signal sequence [Catalinimonas alkaloidigena]
MPSSRRSFLKQSATLLATAPLATPGLSSPTAKPRLRFAVASDGHFGQPDTPFEETHAQMVDWLNREAGERGLDFVFFNGDLIHDDPQMLPRVKTHFDRLQVPYYVSKGNHDQVTDAVWRRQWGYGENHDFALNDIGFVVGKTSNLAGDYLCADTAWLAEALQRHRKRSHVFVFLHIPQRTWAKASIDCPDVMRLLEQTPNLAAVFHGHDHSTDDVKVSAGKSFCFDGHIGGSWGVAYHGYRIVEVQADGSVHSFQFNPAAQPVVNTNRLTH